jgi:hypothetical protein
MPFYLGDQNLFVAEKLLGKLPGGWTGSLSSKVSSSDRGARLTAHVRVTGCAYGVYEIAIGADEVCVADVQSFDGEFQAAREMIAHDRARAFDSVHHEIYRKRDHLLRGVRAPQVVRRRLRHLRVRMISNWFVNRVNIIDPLITGQRILHS